MENRRVLTVLRSGGEYMPWHVHALQRQVKEHAPDARFQCLTDVDIPGVETIPLLYGWPGWFAKIEMLRADIGGGFLYSDLDNVILGPIEEFFRRHRYTTQRGGWNALAYIPEGGAQEYVEEFKHAPGEHMMQHAPSGVQNKPFGDAGFMAARMSGPCWEDVLPGAVVNICEIHSRAPWPFKRSRNPLPPETKVLLCSAMYGRPWQMPEFLSLYVED